MEWHVNDLSLHGQFSSSEDAKAALEAILSLRSRRSDLSSRLFCSRSLGKRHLTPTQTLQEFAQSHPDRNFRSSLIRWIAGQGPFWSDDRATVENDDDLFYLRTTEVTEQGLGEASRRMLLTIPAASFSVEGSDPEFEKGLLTVVHGLLEQPLSLVEVPNCYGPSVLETNTPVDITSWQGMLNLAATKKYLSLSNSIALALKPKPFSPSLADRVLLLLDILSSLAEEGARLLLSLFGFGGEVQGDKGVSGEQAQEGRCLAGLSCSCKHNDGSRSCLFCEGNEPHPAVVLAVEAHQPCRVGRGLAIADGLLKDHRDGSAIAVDGRLRQVVAGIQIRLD